jgi:hypothetical protein
VTLIRCNPGKCPNCGQVLDGLDVPGGGTPEPGYIVICLYCSHLTEWTGTAFVELSDEAIKEIAGDKDMLAALECAARFQRMLKENP